MPRCHNTVAMFLRLHLVLMLILMTLGHAAPNSITFVDENGQACKTCAGLEPQGSCQPANDHGDCHDCCFAAPVCGGLDHQDLSLVSHDWPLFLESASVVCDSSIGYSERKVLATCEHSSVTSHRPPSLRAPPQSP